MVPAYWERRGEGFWAAAEDMFTTSPFFLASIPGRTSHVMREVEFTLSSTIPSTCNTQNTRKTWKRG